MEKSAPITRRELRKLKRERKAKRIEEIEDALEQVTLVAFVGMFFAGLLLESHWIMCSSGWVIGAFIAYRLIRIVCLRKCAVLSLQAAPTQE